MIFGLPDGNENYHSCEIQVLRFLNDYADYKTWNDVDAERAHRIGKFEASKSRPIIIKFCRWFDKMRLLRDHVIRGAMRKDGFRLAVDLTRQQRLQLRHLKQEGKSGYFRNGKLHIIDNARVNSHSSRADSVKDSLPRQLHRHDDNNYNERQVYDRRKNADDCEDSQSFFPSSSCISQPSLSVSPPPVPSPTTLVCCTLSNPTSATTINNARVIVPLGTGVIAPNINDKCRDVAAPSIATAGKYQAKTRRGNETTSGQARLSNILTKNGTSYSRVTRSTALSKNSA
ncbi:hypothetical protein C0Q70_15759 [Pomacea canaliculata]|uniref:Uncharacterized protein n=1 Tax=Pomacea canaliculata TaxID=400727 RepID=A0A2T7NVR4_POMCA|nr:hypothetical protein C0Q70_15759 [Pomacea canaliculata]